MMLLRMKNKGRDYRGLFVFSRRGCARGVCVGKRGLSVFFG